VKPASAPIFVVGTGRSGTSLLRCMLSAHPRIYVSHEASFYAWMMLYQRRGTGTEFLDYFFKTASFRWLRVDPARVLAGLPTPLPRERLPEAFAAVMREKAAQYGRPRYGDKTPSHSRFIGRILEDFPGARIVYIVRDPRATVLSMSQMPWAAASFYANAVFCELDWRHAKKYLDRMHLVRLEDLLADPEKQMRAILDFVGEPWDPAVLDHVANHPDKHDMPPLPWLESAVQARVAPEPRWMKLPPMQIRMIEDICKRTMKDCGYAPAELRLAREPGKLRLLLEEFRELPSAVRYLFTYWRLAQLSKDPANFDGDRMMAVFRKVNPGAWAHYPGFETMPNPPALPPRGPAAAPPEGALDRVAGR
jgi:hypothetical protein